MSSLRDPTIPRSRGAARDGSNAGERGAARGPVEGRLVDYGETVVLVDHHGNSYPQDRIRWVGGSFGFGQEGFEKAPRPWKFDSGGQVLVEGDWLIVDFIDGNTRRPFVRGGVRSTKPSDFYSAQPIGGDPNHLKWRLLDLDDSGSQRNYCDLEINETNGVLELRLGGSSTAQTAVRVQIDTTARTVKVGRGAETQRVLLGDLFLTELNKVLAEVVAIGAAAVVPTPNTTNLINLIIAALANPADTTLLSATLKTE